MAIGTTAAIIGGAAALGSAAIASSAQRRAQDSAESFAREQQQAAEAEQRRLEEKFGLTPGELERQDRVFELEKERQGELERRAGLSGEELIREQGPITSGLLDQINERLGLTGEDLFLRDTGEAGSRLVDEISGEDDELFKREFDLVLQQINQEANRRGVFGGGVEGGVRFENLGRAGVDFALEKARERLTQRQNLSNAFLSLAQGARGEAAVLGENALDQSGLARQELQKFLNDIQALDQGSKGRAAQTALGAAGIADAQRGRSFNTITDIFGQQSTTPPLAAQGLSTIGDIALSGGFDNFLKDTSPKPPRSTLEDFGGLGERPALQGVLERSGRTPGIFGPVGNSRVLKTAKFGGF